MSYKVPKAHFAKIAHRVTRDKNVSHIAFRIYVYIAGTNQDKFNLTASKLGKILNISKPAVLKAMKELEDLDYLYRERLTKNQTKFHLFSTPKTFK